MKFLKVVLACIVLLALILSHSARAQEQANTSPVRDTTVMKTLLTLPKISYLGLYVIPEYQLGRMNGQFTSLGGGSVMLSLNKKLSIGVSGFSTFDHFTPSQVNSPNALEMRSRFGGVRLEYTLYPNKLIHVSFPLLIGGGFANYDSTEGRMRYDPGMYGYRSDPFHHAGTNFFLVQPGVNVEANVLRFVKVYAGASYRIAAGDTRTSSVISAPNASQIQGLSFSAGVKIGYDFWLHRKR